nr:universal stress protein [Burkholderiaceae bacterium]
MRLGRPLLLVPPAMAVPKLDRALVAWKDTREARRAVVDGLPLLRLAREVQVVEVADQPELTMARERVGDIVAWLGRHGVQATANASAGGDDHGAVLSAIATQWGADLIVAGAYGHNRLREWVLGGVTRELLLKSERCALLSH